MSVKFLAVENFLAVEKFLPLNFEMSVKILAVEFLAVENPLNFLLNVFIPTQDRWTEVRNRGQKPLGGPVLFLGFRQ